MSFQWEQQIEDAARLDEQKEQKEFDIVLQVVAAAIDIGYIESNKDAETIAQDILDTLREQAQGAREIYKAALNRGRP